MLWRFLHRRDGSLRYGRLVALLGAAIAMAVFGGGLIWIVPSLTPSPLLRGLWVLFAIGVLKLPLILLLWAFIRRNREWPGSRVPWGDDEVAAILRNLAEQADDAETRPDRAARLAFLSREAWNVADQVAGAAKVDALTVALRIDERLMDQPSREIAG